MDVKVGHAPDGLPNVKPITSDGSDKPHELTAQRFHDGSIQIETKDCGVGSTQDQPKQLFTEDKKDCSVRTWSATKL